MNKNILHPKTVHDAQKGRLKSKGQSLVEFAIAFPVLIILFSGLIEFGFMLNYYLSLLDATRESARYWANFDPFDCGTTPPTSAVTCVNLALYQGAVDTVRLNLEPQSLNDTSRKITLDPATDDIIVSAFDIQGTPVVVKRYPLGGGYHAVGYANILTGAIDEAFVRKELQTDSPNKVVLSVEVFYTYHQILALPWLNLIFDQNRLHAYTMMPLPPNTLGTHAP